ncbi:Hydroperoxide isomerase aloxe3 [Fusarium falciforme]|uniref:Hydroperoxide isomerase aloxe3 n=1 Tax=Fusarium falciforme TaxID=195108 RepID=A0A9W8QTH7_9HYPO|nr:Hydroperoxide isomerase aloxe3 [Fusarium falciforme]KAJ4175943.1 Hydroperoxide isomerase aloxe3 [Fusarium falciforme]KAJ4177192.1 Hydroperoxide isomerase aloxe3 [Fusarium falciforme]KAJ4234759.1 Hydroperoxide isomerase aloxe3 [Fusarium falciforme]
MLLKSLLLTLLLGAFSVSALPNPEAEDFGLEARDDDNDLTARDYKPPKCGYDSGAYWKHGRCHCKNRWEDYNKYSKKCEKKCGHDAYWKNGDCHCKNRWEDYNKYSKKCEKKCGEDAYWKHGRCHCKNRWEDYNKHSKKCEKKCGEDAYWKKGKCRCKNKGEKFNEWKKECYCPKGKKCGGYGYGYDDNDGGD